LKLRKATEYPVDAKDDSDLRHGLQPGTGLAQIAGKKKSGNPHLRGPSRLLKLLQKWWVVWDSNLRPIG
jgi:hypothetical protein